MNKIDFFLLVPPLGRYLWKVALKAWCFRIDKNVVSGTEKRSAKIFGKEIRPKFFGKWTKMP